MLRFFLALLLKKRKGRAGVASGNAASVLIFGYTLSKNFSLSWIFTGTMDTLPVDPALFESTVKDAWELHMLPIFSASVCREAGYGSVAGQIELFAKLSIVALSIPELWVLLRLIEQMTGGRNEKKLLKFCSGLFCSYG